MRVLDASFGLCALFLGMGIASGWVPRQSGGPRSSPTVEAERIILRDSSGKVRGELAPHGTEGVHLNVYDSEGKPRAMFKLGPGVAVLNVSVDPGPFGHLIKAEGSETPGRNVGLEIGEEHLRFFGKDITTRLEVAVPSKGETNLVLRGSDGGVVFKAP